MGFFSKIKQGFSQMVGGTGSMQITLDKQHVERGGSVTVTALLSATGQLKGNSVNLEVAATETIKYQVPVVSTTQATPSGSAASAGSPAMQAASTTSTSTEMTDETKDNQTYSNRQIVDGTPFVMNQGETRNYTGTVQIPQGVQTTYKGVDAVHVWKVRAYVDVPMGADIGAEAEITVS